MRSILLYIVLLCTMGMHAQVGVNTQQVSANVALQVESPEQNKGVIIPRMDRATRDLIHPQITEDGLTIYNIEEDCINYWVAAEGKWRSACGTEGNAEYSIIRCTNIEVPIGFEVSKTLNTTHDILLEVEVTKRGAYHIGAQSSTSNGYFFSDSGKFLAPGIYTVRLEAVGRPVNARTDVFTIYLNGAKNNGQEAGQELPACTFDVKVEPTGQAIRYGMLCGSITTHGIYQLGVPLTSEHYIELDINIASNFVANTKYRIETEEVDGIKFKGTGNLVRGNNGNQRIRLYGEGIPITTDKKRFTLRSNSTTNIGEICYAYVTMVAPKKRLLSIGREGYNAGPTTGLNQLLRAESNYGQQSTSHVAFEGWTADNIILESSPSPAQLRTYLTGDNPVDIVMISYPWVITEEHASLLMGYLREGGVVLAFTESNTGSARLLRQVFGSNSIGVKNGGPAGSVYFVSAVDDTVLNGPFGDLRNGYWGEDGSATSIAYGIDRNSIFVYSDSYDQSGSESFTPGVTAFRHKAYNFIWVGDGGFTLSNGVGSKTSAPFQLSSGNLPLSKAYGRGTERQVSNALFTANAIAWAIEQAEKNGINSNNKIR